METDDILTKERLKYHRLTPEQAKAHQRLLEGAWERLRDAFGGYPTDDVRLADEKLLGPPADPEPSDWSQE
jgi:hypothetical protein